MSGTTMTRWLAVALVAVWLAPMGAFADEAADVGTKADAVGNKKPKGGKTGKPGKAGNNSEERKALAAARRAKFAGAKAPPKVMWWNEEGIVKELGLSSEHRAQFDADQKALVGTRVKRTTSIKTKRAYHTALKKGDFVAAKTLLAEWSSQTAKPIDDMGALKLKVLATLTPVQFDALTTNYASIIQTDWVPKGVWAGPRRSGSAKRSEAGTQGTGKRPKQPKEE